MVRRITASCLGMNLYSLSQLSHMRMRECMHVRIKTKLDACYTAFSHVTMSMKELTNIVSESETWVLKQRLLKSKSECIFTAESTVQSTRMLCRGETFTETSAEFGS
jgi:hypothetical protein